jgi:hypothetical protein
LVFILNYFLIPVRDAYKAAALFSTFALLLPLAFLYQNGSARDRKIGELSYPIYIGHMLVISTISVLARKLGWSDPFAITMANIAGATAFAALFELAGGRARGSLPDPAQSRPSRHRVNQVSSPKRVLSLDPSANQLTGGGSLRIRIPADARSGAFRGGSPSADVARPESPTSHHRRDAAASRRWRERMGIEPTRSRSHDPPLILKTRPGTSTGNAPEIAPNS